jgi:uncharacterized protein YxjI
MKTHITIFKLTRPRSLGVNYQINNIQGAEQVETISGSTFVAGDLLTSKDVDDIINAQTKNKFALSIRAE